ncbi:hypothetical protein MTR67_041614 [Solanum verrucosum]|uniref:F-box associated beta-propeller type 3 domain-containing protein n=1 Tax=Solanum verrucosum TaxID=315347 RepID=A0AAF0ZTA8_SOLVR|nr:hypothetical protein MTR67_041614 [Solanum verrucosum]
MVMFNKNPYTRICSLRSLFNDSVTETSYLNIPMKEPYESYHILSSVNGLICLSCRAGEKEDLILWNPSIRKCRKLPSFESELINVNCYYHCGLIYDEFHDDYKEISRNIVSFDLTDEKWGKAEKPSFGEGDIDSRLEVLGSNLSVFCYNKRSFKIYNPKDNSFSPKIINYDREAAEIYIESLVSPFPSEDQTSDATKIEAKKSSDQMLPPEAEYSKGDPYR